MTFANSKALNTSPFPSSFPVSNGFLCLYNHLMMPVSKHIEMHSVLSEWRLLSHFHSHSILRARISPFIQWRRIEEKQEEKKHALNSHPYTQTHHHSGNNQLLGVECAPYFLASYTLNFTIFHNLINLMRLHAKYYSAHETKRIVLNECSQKI